MLKQLRETPIGETIYNIKIDDQNTDIEVHFAPNSCTNSKGQRCVWADSKEGCPRLGFCLKKCSKFGSRPEFVCYIKKDL